MSQQMDDEQINNRPNYHSQPMDVEGPSRVEHLRLPRFERSNFNDVDTNAPIIRREHPDRYNISNEIDIAEIDTDIIDTPIRRYRDTSQNTSDTNSAYSDDIDGGKNKKRTKRTKRTK